MTRRPQETLRTGGTSLRLFVALDLPQEARAAIESWQALVFTDLPDIRVNRSLHLTLCFLGQVPADAVPTLESALSRIVLESFRLALGAPLFLPQRGSKRVVALPLVDSPDAPGGLEALLRLQASVSQALATTGLYRPERRAYLPHLTVARYRRPGRAFCLQNVTLPRLLPSPLVLYTSDLARGGAVHTPLATFSAP